MYLIDLYRAQTGDDETPDDVLIDLWEAAKALDRSEISQDQYDRFASEVDAKYPLDRGSRS